MATIKAFTDLSQSNKLVDILPLESADMEWINGDGLGEPFPFVGRTNDEEGLPCWSLATLLDVLPLRIYDDFDDCDYELQIHMIDKMPRYIRLGDIYHSKFPYDFEKDTLLDNIVESIIWLKENNKL